MIHRLFLIIAMYCQASSSHLNESLNLPRCQLAGHKAQVHAVGSNSLETTYILFKLAYLKPQKHSANLILIKKKAKCAIPLLDERQALQQDSALTPQYGQIHYEIALVLICVHACIYIWYFVTKIVLTYCEKKMFQ